MAEMKIAHREWAVEYRLAEGEASDTIKPYTTITMRPFMVIATFSAKFGELPKLCRFKVIGHRVNKSGLGGKVDAVWYGYYQKPAWMTRVVEATHALIMADIGNGQA